MPVTGRAVTSALLKKGILKLTNCPHRGKPYACDGSFSDKHTHPHRGEALCL